MPVVSTHTDLPLYMRLARDLEQQIEKGAFQLGDPVPSVRVLSRQRRVSVSTVLQAYFWLENRGRIEARPKSGFYVRTPLRELIPEPKAIKAKSAPARVSTAALIAEVISAGGNPDKIPFGAACVSTELMPNHKLSAIMRNLARNHPDHSAQYAVPRGVESLRREIARRSYERGCAFVPEDILITCGAMEALNLALRAVGKPGDVIATESPAYFGILQAIDSMGMKAVEIPTHPREGMDLDALETAIRKHKVRACVAMTNSQNPMGFVLADEKKKALVRLLEQHDLPLIEDDVYGDLALADVRPSTAKSFDRNGQVLLVGSFSKTIAPGLRVGWIHPGRFQSEVVRLKLLATIATSSLPQLAVARFLESGGYDRHLRMLRSAMARHVDLYSQAISRYFPTGTRISRPQGGYVLWVELPAGADAVKLHREALEKGISISPGPIFSASGRFRNCLRINCGSVWSDRIDGGLLKLGRLCESVL